VQCLSQGYYSQNGPNWVTLRFQRYRRETKEIAESEPTTPFYGPQSNSNYMESAYFGVVKKYCYRQNTTKRPKMPVTEILTFSMIFSLST